MISSMYSSRVVHSFDRDRRAATYACICIGMKVNLAPLTLRHTDGKRREEVSICMSPCASSPLAMGRCIYRAWQLHQ